MPEQMERLASPISYVSSDDPPLLILHGTNDKTVLMDQSERMVQAYEKERLSAELIEVAGAGHGGVRFFQGKLMEKVIGFLLEHRPER